MKNYYQTIQLPPDATQEGIKRAYRLYAKNFHPDKHQGNPFFEERFKEVQEAYEVLSDIGRRAAYDERSKPKTAPYQPPQASSQASSKATSSSKETYAQPEEMKFGDSMPIAIRKKPISDLGWRLVKAAFVLEIIWMPFRMWTKNDFLNYVCIGIFASCLALGSILWRVGSLFKI